VTTVTGVGDRGARLDRCGATPSNRGGRCAMSSRIQLLLIALAALAFAALNAGLPYGP
jgi:hypothetical protein